MLVNLEGWKNLERKDFFKKFESRLMSFKKGLIRTNNDFTFLRSNNNYQLNSSIKFAENKFKKFDKIVVIGTGGSTLGAKAVLQIANKNRVLFIENIDSSELKSLIRRVTNLKFALIVISKSGETIEILSLLDILTNHFKKTLNFKKDILVITEKKESTLYDFANKKKISILELDPLIIGRFSVFSIAGLLPIHLSGINSQTIKKHADLSFVNNIKSDKLKYDNSIIKLASVLEEKKYVGHVLMFYVDSFEGLASWYKQLWTESIGKNKYGMHIITAKGAQDQHSQLQMWLDGPDNLIFTVIIPKKRKLEFRTSRKKDKILPIYLQNKRTIEILGIQGEATAKELNRAKRPVRIIYLEDDGINSAVTLMTTLMLEVALIAKILKINPFNQPAVESVKTRTKDLLKKNV